MRKADMLVVDTHAHLFSTDERTYPPKQDPSRPPEGTGTLEQLTERVERHEVRAVTIVQVSGFYGFDNRFVRDVALKNPHWTAAICTLNPHDTDAPEALRRFARDGSMRGLRSVPASEGRLDHPGVRALWRAASEEGLPVNVLGGHELESQLDSLLTAFPSLPVALDHSLRLQAGGEMEATLSALERLSRHRHLYAKLSFIANGKRGCQAGWPCTSMHRVLLRVIDLFGAERCAWGSHFPTEKYARPLSYGQHLDIFRSQLPLSETARRQILGETARRLWFPELDRRG